MSEGGVGVWVGVYQFSVFPTISISCVNGKWKMEILATREGLSMDLNYMVEISE